MDHESLRTACTYLNNLLLARGLLRNGEAIDFVKPSKESRAQIINLVHDLILREDRDKDRREHIADTLRHLRSEDARKTHEIERLQAKSDESARAAVQAQQAERVALAEVKKVERAMKALQDQSAKLKITLAQVRMQCANDVKKRDLELARLKTHLQGQQRGTRVGMQAPSMTVRKAAVDPSTRDIEDPAYSLRQETTEFLTQLSQSLSDENDSLITLIRDALSTMRELLGLPANAKMIHPDSAVGSMGSNEEVNGKNKPGSNMLQPLPTSYETLSKDLETMLGHLKTILTNPNFVSMEEVEVREEEIVRLREGWEHMEKRWLEVLQMMHGWVKRMNTGDMINIEDLRKGMGLVTPGAQSKIRSRQLSGPNARKQFEDLENSLVESETSSLHSPTDSGVRMSKNGREAHPSQPRSRETEMSKRKHDVLEPPEFFDLRPPSTTTRPVPVSSPKTKGPPREALDLLDDDEDSEELEIPQMTIAEKLSAVQKEAAEAQAARALDAQPTASGRASARRGPAFEVDGVMDEADDDTLGKMPGDAFGKNGSAMSPMAKKTKIRGRPRKRSTLSRDELAALISDC